MLFDPWIPAIGFKCKAGVVLDDDDGDDGDDGADGEGDDGDDGDDLDIECVVSSETWSYVDDDGSSDCWTNGDEGNDNGSVEGNDDNSSSFAEGAEGAGMDDVVGGEKVEEDDGISVCNCNDWRRRDLEWSGKSVVSGGAEGMTVDVISIASSSSCGLLGEDVDDDDDDD